MEVCDRFRPKCLLKRLCPFLTWLFGFLMVGCASTGGALPTSVTLPLLPPSPAFRAPLLPLITIDDPANTAEFRANYGLLSLNAHGAYARGVTGAGITVAIIDDGVDIDHPDLDGNISPLSLDIRTGRFEDIDTQETHGTQIAGIIAAERNNIGSHGVAYGADILVIRAFDTDGAVSDIVDGIDCARENGARILNLSLTINTLPFELRQALDRAVDGGMLIILSAGNSPANSTARSRLDALSNYATFGSANGQALAVGAIDNENNLFFLSNRPGQSGANVYVLAPGVDIVSTTVGGGLYQLNPSSNPSVFGVDLHASGTSFAAPHVAGAAAVLWEMFPNLKAEEVVEILVRSAVDVGPAGVDPITGHGIIDLGAATQPKGELSIAFGLSSFGAKTSVEGTHLVSGPAFGDALVVSGAFEGGVVQDVYRRAYAFDYREMTSAAQSSLNIERLLKNRIQNRRQSFSIGTNTNVNLSVNKRKDVLLNRPFESDITVGAQRYTASKYTDFAVATEAVLPNGSLLSSSSSFGSRDFVNDSLGVASSNLSNSASSLSDLGDLVGGGSSLSWRTRLSNSSVMNISFSTQEHSGVLNDSAAQNNKYEMSISETVGSNFIAAVTLGRILEVGSALGLEGVGAFTGIKNSSTSYVKVGIASDGKKVTPFATAQFGITDIVLNRESLFSDFSTLWTSSFSIGLRSRNNLFSRDRFQLSLSQPVRVEVGEAYYSLATAIDENDQITRSLRKLRFRPSARELAFNVMYSVPVGEYVFSSEFLRRVNPQHTNGAKHEDTLLVSMMLGF